MDAGRSDLASTNTVTTPERGHYWSNCQRALHAFAPPSSYTDTGQSNQTLFYLPPP